MSFNLKSGLLTAFQAASTMGLGASALAAHLTHHPMLAAAEAVAGGAAVIGVGIAAGRIGGRTDDLIEKLRIAERKGIQPG